MNVLYNHVEVSLGIILRISDSRFLWIGKGVWFSIRFSSFLLYRYCKKLREFEEIDISSKAVEVFANSEEENS
jgi:hypothetical protein